MIRGLLRLLGYVLLLPFITVAALFFGLPILLALLIADAFPDDDLHEFRVVVFALILTLIQNTILIIIAREVFLP